MWKFQKKKNPKSVKRPEIIKMDKRAACWSCNVWSEPVQVNQSALYRRDLSVIACTFVFTLQSVLAISVGVKECPRPLTGGSVL